MAAAPLRRLIRIGRWLLAFLALVVIGFPLAGWIGSSIPRSGGVEAPASGESVTIMVETNGTHTGIVVPVANAIKDWRHEFPSAARPRLQDSRLPTHLAIGWGEREVFLTVPTWGDLKASTVARIVFTGGDPLMRVGHYVNPQPTENFRPVKLSAAQYRRLVSAIEAALPAMEVGEYRETLRATYAYDAYYEATGSYTIANTCNSWVGDTLAASGIEMGLWTPFAGGVTKWIAKPEGEL